MRPAPAAASRPAGRVVAEEEEERDEREPGAEADCADARAADARPEEQHRGTRERGRREHREPAGGTVEEVVERAARRPAIDAEPDHERREGREREHGEADEVAQLVDVDQRLARRPRHSATRGRGTCRRPARSLLRRRLLGRRALRRRTTGAGLARHGGPLRRPGEESSPRRGAAQPALAILQIRPASTPAT